MDAALIVEHFGMSFFKEIDRIQVPHRRKKKRLVFEPSQIANSRFMACELIGAF